MMLQTQKLEIAPFISMALRRKWWVLIPLVVSVFAAVGFLKLAPKTYKSATLILLEPQSIPDSFVRSTIPETMEGRLRTITQQIQSRTNLERIIGTFHLDSVQHNSIQQILIRAVNSYLPFLGKGESPKEQDQTTKQLSMFNSVEAMRKNIKISMRSSGPGGGDGRSQNLAFEIAFEWQDPELVAQVTNAIASRFIEENLNAREELAVGTTDFLDQEAAAIRGELEAREKELESFKNQNMGMLPDQRESNLNILTQLREQLVNVERRLEQEKQQANLLKSQAQAARIERQALATVLRPGGGQSTGTRRDQQMTTEQLTSGNLEDLEAELERLNSLYTDRHPDIVALKRRIEALKKEGKRVEPGGAGQSSPDVHMNRIAPQLAQINANINSYQRELREVENQIQSYKERIERAPQVEMALNKVLRDYQTVRQRYDSLLAKKLDAKMSEQLEKRKKGEQFRILDPAVKPLKPFKPDPLRVMAIAVAAGLGLGCGLAYLREMLDPCFHNPEELEDYLGAKVMLSLPTVKSEQ